MRRIDLSKIPIALAMVDVEKGMRHDFRVILGVDDYVLDRDEDGRPTSWMWDEGDLKVALFNEDGITWYSMSSFNLKTGEWVGERLL